MKQAAALCGRPRRGKGRRTEPRTALMFWDYLGEESCSASHSGSLAHEAGVSFPEGPPRSRCFPLQVSSVHPSNIVHPRAVEIFMSVSFSVMGWAQRDSETGELYEECEQMEGGRSFIFLSTWKYSLSFLPR